MKASDQGFGLATDKPQGEENIVDMTKLREAKKGANNGRRKAAPVEDVPGNCWRFSGQSDQNKSNDPVLFARVTNFGAISLNYRLQSEFSRVTSSECYFGVIFFSDGKTKKFLCSKLDAQPSHFLNLLIQLGADCPVPSKVLAEAVSEQFIRQAKDGGQVYTVPGWNASLMAFVASNGVIKNGELLKVDAFKKVIDSKCMSFVHDLKESCENFASFPRFPEHVFGHGPLSTSADDLATLWQSFHQAGIDDLTCANVLMLARTMLCTDDLTRLKLAYGMPFIFVSGAMGSGKTETVGDLTRAYYFIERQNVSAGSTYPNARNKLCERGLPVFFEEAHRRETRCSLHNETFATDLRRLYTGSDLSNANHSYTAIGFPVFDGINEGNLPADLKERIHFVALPWSSKSKDETIGQLIRQIKDAIPAIQSGVVENLKLFTANSPTYFLSLKRKITYWEQHLNETFQLKGRDTWPALVMAIAELTDGFFGWFEAMKIWLRSYAERKKEHALPRLAELLEGLVEYDSKRPLRFENNVDSELVIDVPGSDKRIVRINYVRAISLVRVHSSLGQNIHKKHLLEELGFARQVDKDPMPSSYSWLKRDRSKAAKGDRPKVLGGQRYFEFSLTDSALPESIRELLEELAAKSWPATRPNPFVETEEPNSEGATHG